MNDNYQGSTATREVVVDAAALKDALDESSNRNRNLFITFLIVQAYFLLAIIGTTDLHLLLPESEFKLPIINIVVPIFAFYICAPVFLLAFHFNLLTNLLEHSRKLYRWVESKNPDQKLTLHPFLINFLVNHKEGELNYFILRLIISMLYVVLPLFIFCAIQFRFSDYHSLVTTLWHFAFVLADIFIIGIYWTRISCPELLANEFNTWKMLKHCPAFQRQTFVTIYRCVVLAPWVFISSLFLYFFMQIEAMLAFAGILIATALLASFLQEHFIRCWPHIGLNSSFLRNQKMIAQMIFKTSVFEKSRLPIVLFFPFFLLVVYTVALFGFGVMPIVFLPFYIVAAMAGTRFIVVNALKGKKNSRIMTEVVILNLFILLWPIGKLLGSVARSIRSNNDQFWTNIIVLAAIFNLMALIMVIYTEPSVPDGVAHSLSLHSNVNMFLPHLDLSEAQIVDVSQKGRSDLFPPDSEGSPYDQWLREFKSINLQGRDLKRVVFTKAALFNVDLRRADLFGADFREANVFGGDFSEARMIRVDFSSGHLRNVKMFNARLSDAKLADTEWIEVYLRAAVLPRASLKCAKIQGTDMGGAQLPNASLAYAALYGVDLDNAYLEKADFSQSKCYGVNFFSARELATADLGGADLKGCRLCSFEQIQEHIRYSAPQCDLDIIVVESKAEFDALNHRLKSESVADHEGALKITIAGVKGQQWMVSGFNDRSKFEQVRLKPYEYPDKELVRELEKGKDDQDRERIMEIATEVIHLNLLSVSRSLVDYVKKETADRLPVSIREDLIMWRLGDDIQPFWEERRKLACDFPRIRKGLIEQNRSFKSAYRELFDPELKSYISANCKDQF